MNPLFWAGVVVVLLGLIVAVTLGMTKWRRIPLEQARREVRSQKKRVSGEDD
jgi:hypothetical protein